MLPKKVEVRAEATEEGPHPLSLLHRSCHHSGMWLLQKVQLRKGEVKGRNTTTFPSSHLPIASLWSQWLNSIGSQLGGLGEQHREEEEWRITSKGD